MTLAGSTRGAIRDYLCEGRLLIDTTELCTPAWVVSGLAQLWGLTFAWRRTDRTVPFADGVQSFPQWQNLFSVSLPMVITGHVNSSGSAYADAMAGLASNMEDLETAVLPPDPFTAIFRTAHVYKPNGTHLTGDCLVSGIRPGGVTSGIMRATLELAFPYMMVEA